MQPLESHRRCSLILFACMAVHALLTASYSITLHYSLKTSAFDLPAFEQPIYNILHGYGFTTSVLFPYTAQPFMGVHFSPILCLLIPVYYLFPHPEAFLLTGSLLVALAAWPVFLTAETLLGNARQALLVALLYLINPFVLNGVAWNFHEVDFAPLTIAAMLWAVAHKKRAALLLLACILLCIKEHYGLAVAAFGILWAWRWREPKFGLALSAFGIAVFCFLLLYFIPHLNPLGKLEMMNPVSPMGRFNWLASRQGIQLHIAHQGWQAAIYIAWLLLPFLLLPLGAFMWLLPAVSDVSINLLSLEPFMRSPQAYYTMPVIPVLAVALCQALRQRVPAKHTANVMLALLMASLTFGNLQLVLPFSHRDIWEVSSPHFDYSPENRKALDDINALIPPDAAVLAQVNALPHLHLRYGLYPYPMSPGDAEYMVLNLAFPFTHHLAVFGIPYNPHSHYFSEVTAILHNEHWGVVYYSSRWVVLRKDAPDNAQAHQQALQALESLKAEYAAVRKIALPAPIH